MQHADPIYQPIGGSALRLLLIKPGLPDEQVECTTVTISDLEDTPAFEAVSYAPSQELSPDPVLCNGVRKSVTRNLGNALRGLRPLPNWASVPLWSSQNPLHSTRNVWHGFARNRYEDVNTVPTQGLWWIDALCVNQDDAAERAGQAKLRVAIYRKATAVRIWLEYEPANMPVVLAFVAQALKNANEQRDKALSLGSSHDWENRNKAHGFPSPSAKAWTALWSFLSDPWFEQVWTFQEVVLAQTAVVVVGDWHLDWAAVGRAAAWLSARGYSRPRTLTAPNSQEQGLPIASIAAAWEMHAVTGKRAPLLYLLKEFRLRYANFQADKVYAALNLADEAASIADDGPPILLEPDYDRTVQVVYRNVAVFLIVEHGSLLVLSQVDRHPADTPESPSWVPDWSRVKSSSDIWATPNQRGRVADGHEKPSMQITADGNCLILEGLQTDAVLTYTHILDSRGPGDEIYESERRFALDAWKTMMGRVNGCRGDEEAQRRMVRSFVEALTVSPAEFVNDDHAEMKDAFAWFRKYLSLDLRKTGGATRWKWLKDSEADCFRFHRAFVRACADRRFFVTRDGLMGIGPRYMSAGDSIVILFGGKVPFVMRKEGSVVRLIGECYVSGLMSGQAIVKGREFGQRRETFAIM